MSNANTPHNSTDSENELEESLEPQQVSSCATLVLTTPELIDNIFNFLSMSELMNVRSVCKQWYLIVNIPTKIASYIKSTFIPRRVYVLSDGHFHGNSNPGIKILGVYTHEQTVINEMRRLHKKKIGVNVNCKIPSPDTFRHFDGNIVSNSLYSEGTYQYLKRDVWEVTYVKLVTRKEKRAESAFSLSAH
ncbi:13567_t:CDS:1 [Funneliformis geosporum]|uniref:243_t:CDS:1 n=1 Tax=Funneliformis geosporum TaxID=1117311 RepID=A0A9W4WU55_9GLOM|nr:13567_t:CDS:1 [Funneliformis geosporum]CAI2163805.1 243_t:CDS:1 [Funneliformis geosporum]